MNHAYEIQVQVYSCLLPEYDPSECDLFCENPSPKSDFKESLCVIPSKTIVCLRIFLLNLDKSSGQKRSRFKFILFFNVSKILALSHPIPCENIQYQFGFCSFVSRAFFFLFDGLKFQSNIAKCDFLIHSVDVFKTLHLWSSSLL